MAVCEPSASIASLKASSAIDDASVSADEVCLPMTDGYSQSHSQSIPISNPIGIGFRLTRGPVTVTASRLADAMRDAGEDQSSLARAIGITQGAVSKILQGKTANSRHLPRIALHLGASLPWLLGETEDPQLNQPAPSAPVVHFVTMQVALPSERALARMFEGLLRSMDLSAPVDAQALLLAKRLPIGLSQLRDLLPDPGPTAAAPAERPADLAMTVPGSRP